MARTVSSGVRAVGHAEPMSTTASRGAALSLVSQVVQQLCSIAATIVLARILVPSDFGLVAAATSILGIAYVALSLGFGPSILRRVTLTDDFVQTIFWTAAGLSALAASVLAVASYLIVRPAFDTEVAWYVAAAGPTLVFVLANSVPNALLLREFRYFAYQAIQVASVVLYLVVQILLALNGFGAWSVLIGQYAMGVSVLLGSLVASRWRPRATFRPSLLRGELRFGTNLLSSQAGAYTSKNVDFWAVGAVLGAGVLGVYYIAYVLPVIVRQRVATSVTTALAPVFTKFADDAARRARALERTTVTVVGVFMPLIILIAALAEPLIRFFFGSGWAGAVQPLRFVALAASVELLMVGMGRFMQFSDRFGTWAVFQWCEALAVAAGVVIAVTSGHGIVVVAAVVGAVKASSVLARLWWVGRVLRVDSLHLLLVAVKVAAMSVIAATPAFLLAGTSLSAFVVLVLGTTLALLLYLSVGWAASPHTIRPIVQETWQVALANLRRVQARRRTEAAR